MHFGLIIVWEFSSQRPFLDFFRLAVDTETSISSYLVNLDDRSIWNWNPKLINHFSNGKLSLRISNFLSSQGEDQLAWRCYKHGTFEVHSYYDTLRWFTGAQFPLCSQWGAKLLCTIAFFFWTGLGLDCGCRQSSEQHLVLIDWCCICKIMSQLSILTTLFSERYKYREVWSDLILNETTFTFHNQNERKSTYSCNCGQSRYLFSCRPIFAHLQLLPQESHPYL